MTPFIYKKIEEQYVFSEKLTIELTAITDDIFESQSGYTVAKETCSCTLFMAMKIPCRHIFKLLKTQERDLFLPTICAYRWTKQYYNQSHPVLTVYGEIHQPRPISVQTIKIPDEANKYKKAASVTKEINNLASTMQSEKYNFYMEQLIALKNNMLNPNADNEDELDVPVHQKSNRVQSNNVFIREPAATSSNISATSTAAEANEYEAGPSYKMATSNTRSEIAAIKLPQKISSIGRPKGKVNTTIGLKRKGTKISPTDVPPAKKKFLELCFPNQTLTIVRWLTNKSVEQITSKKIPRDHIIEDPNVFNRLRNDLVDISGTKKYFDTKAYKYICEEVQKLNKKPWRCVKCNRNLSGVQIMCHSCLDWFHERCVNYK